MNVSRNPGTRTQDGRTVYVNAYVEDPDRLILVTREQGQTTWTLPSTPLLKEENPLAATARLLHTRCGIGTKGLLPLYEDDIGRDGYCIVHHAVIDGMPRQADPRVEIAAMKPEDFLLVTAYPKFYTRLFAVASAKRLYCIVMLRSGKREDHYVHAFSADEARRDFLLGEPGMRATDIIECGLVIGLHVNDTQGRIITTD